MHPPTLYYWGISLQFHHDIYKILHNSSTSDACVGSPESYTRVRPQKKSYNFEEISSALPFKLPQLMQAIKYTKNYYFAQQGVKATAGQSYYLHNILKLNIFIKTNETVSAEPFLPLPQPFSTVPDTAHFLPYPCPLPGQRHNPPFSRRTAASCARPANPG